MNMMQIATKQYLSQEWLDEYRRLAEDQPLRAGATFTIQYAIIGAPEGDVDYYWVMKDGQLLEAALGTATTPDVNLTMQYENAVKLLDGKLGPTTAFMQGKIRATGNVKRLMSFMPVASSAEWKALDLRVRAMTQY
jgi:putative sterol carrier protein